MADMYIISVREDARIRNNDWEKISWPIYVLTVMGRPG